MVFQTIIKPQNDLIADISLGICNLYYQTPLEPPPLKSPLPKSNPEKEESEE